MDAVHFCPCRMLTAPMAWPTPCVFVLEWLKMALWFSWVTVLYDAYYKESGSRTLTALILTIHNRQYRVYEFRIGYDTVILLLSPGLYLWVRWLCVDSSFSSIKQISQNSSNMAVNVDCCTLGVKLHYCWHTLVLTHTSGVSQQAWPINPPL